MDFRIDRFATLYLVNPLLRCASPKVGPATGSKVRSIPILMYHSLSSENEGGVRAYYRTATAPSVFASHMRYLQEQHYRTINLPEAAKLLKTGGMTEKLAVITFDDGYADFSRHALPELSRYGFSATVFLPTAFIGNEPRQFKGKDCLTWGQARELQNAGISFGSHTITHPQLSNLASSAVTQEVSQSKQTIEHELGSPVDSFAYPFAFPQQNAGFVQQLRETLVGSGYQQGVCTRIGTARADDDQYFLRRLPMNSLDDASLFDAKLRGGYDWLYSVQSASKRIKAYVQ